MRAGMAVTAKALEDHAARTLSDFKVPKRYVFEASLPIGKTGKIDKASLSRRLAAEAQQNGQE